MPKKTLKALCLGIRFEDGVTNSIGVKPTIDAKEAAAVLTRHFDCEFDTMFLIINGKDGPMVEEHWELGKHY